MERPISRYLFSFPEFPLPQAVPGNKPDCYTALLCDVSLIALIYKEVADPAPRNLGHVVRGI